MLFLYRLLSIILSPLIALYLLIRAILGKEDEKRLKERFGIPSQIRPPKQIIWLHAVSVGESNSALILIDYLLDLKEDILIVFTTTTISSAKIIIQYINKVERYKSRLIHQFLPVDSYFCVRNFLQYWRPSLTLLVESEIWPNLICESSKMGSGVILINGRISRKSFNYWAIATHFKFNIFDYFKLIFAQNLEAKEYFEQLTKQPILYYGNLKSSALPLEYEPNKLEQLKEEIGVRKIWLAASTHEGEEQMIFRAHQQLKTNFKDLLTIIVPRHPIRATKIIEAAPKELKISQRSKSQTITFDTDIYLADGLGELGLFYRLCKIAFIGGSLIDGIGGHNSFEAARLGCAIISGKFVANNSFGYEQLKLAQACFIIENEEKLVKSVTDLLLDSNLVEKIGGRALNLMNSYDQIPQKIIDQIKNLIIS